jgi:hypothetical protein
LALKRTVLPFAFLWWWWGTAFAVASVSAGSCAPTQLSAQDASDLVRALPVVQKLIHAGRAVTVLLYHPTNERRATFSFTVFTDATETTVLDNGLVGYYAVDAKSAVVLDVTDTEQMGDTAFKAAQIKLRAAHCIRVEKR